MIDVTEYQILIRPYPVKSGATWWRSWLRHCASSRKVEDLILDGVNGIFHWRNPGHTIALGSTQPLTEMSIRNIPWGVKVAGTLGWQPCHVNARIVLKSGILTLLEPSGSVQGFLNFFYNNVWPKQLERTGAYRQSQQLLQHSEILLLYNYDYILMDGKRIVFWHFSNLNLYNYEYINTTF
jgi:hypothetical protein